MRTVLSYLLAFAGVATMAVAIARTFAGSLSYPAARLAMLNLLRSNPNQAEAVCRATKGTFFEAIGAAIKTAAMIKSQDPKILPTATQPAYDAAGMAITASWKQLVGKAKLAVMMVGGAIALGMSAGAVPIFVIVLAVLCVAGGVWLLVYKADVERSIVRARADVLPEVDRAFVEGRYRS